LLLLLFAVVCCGRPGGNVAPDSTNTPPAITLHPAASRALPAYVAVSGLSAADLSTLRERATTDARWPSLLKITVGRGSGSDVEAASDSLPPVEGRYAVTESAITFTPLFPFDPGRAYRVVFDPSRLPRPRQSGVVAAVVRLPAVATEPTTVVTAVHPAADVVPENLLRVYIEFSAPMGNGVGLDFVKLVELAGPGNTVDKVVRTERVEPGAFLPVEANFWSPDHTRYTLFFDPGRVKDGIFPNRQSGRPLRAGRRYALDIAPAWTDANGLPLKAGYRHEFRVGPAVDKPITLSDWTLARPAAGTRDRLVVTVPGPLDHGILVRALGVETKGRPVDGEISLESHDTAWVFIPVAPWRSGEYNLIAQSFLEDPQGNQIGRAFEAFAGEPTNDRAPGNPGNDIAFRLAFTIGEP
ncbi:MAG TPA: hypothetical protein VGJ39_00095, partial [Vicinamibacterales bacterium]